ncbi:TPA: fimbrial protein [Serratia rubidaea]|nr:fimbrial protein [Serratia rubidaea]HDJ1449794.1 fimbrial protein [Serratia rubidaea]HDJ1460893.1 fimbrial protein [Serratia rubidaea]HDJ2772662.1 fimbrial protein [Serratia rubidaea]
MMKYIFYCGTVISGKRMLRCGLLAPLLYCSLYAEDAFATCTAPNGTLNFTSPVIAQRDAPIGTVLATASVDIPVSCNDAGSNPIQDGSWHVYLSSSNDPLEATSLPYVRQTSKPGVGLRWLSRINGGSQASPTQGPLNNSGWVRGVAFRTTTVMNHTFELVKTGEITSGPLDSMSFVLNYRTPISWIDFGALYSVTSNSVAIQKVACAVTTPVINVPLGNVATASFRGIGDTAGTRDFQIPLDCDDQTSVRITLEGNQDDSGAVGVLELDDVAGETVAEGIGVQLLYGASPVVLGDLTAIGIARADGPFMIPLTARYYQTQGRVSAGMANATATFTMTYN